MRYLTNRPNLRICFMGGSQAGVIGALALLAKGFQLLGAVSYYHELTQILHLFKVPIYSSVRDEKFASSLGSCDILLSVHGREILAPQQLGLPKFGCINVHPFLYKYKGANPVGKALKDRNFKGSVGVHRMDTKVDRGKVIVEEFVDVSGAKTADEIYNRLYPYYCIAILKAFDIITGK